MKTVELLGLYRWGHRTVQLRTCTSPKNKTKQKAMKVVQMIQRLSGLLPQFQKGGAAILFSGSQPGSPSHGAGLLRAVR